MLSKTPQKSWILNLTFCLFSLLFMGCAGIGSDIKDCVSLSPHVERILFRPSAFARISALMEGTVETDTHRHTFQAMIVFEGPTSVRIESLSPLGPPVMMLSVTNGRMRLFFPYRNAFYEEEADHLVPFLPLEAGNLPPLLCGVLPPLKPGECLTAPEQEGTEWRYDVMAGIHRRLSVWMSEEGRIIRIVKWQDDGDREVAIRYDDPYEVEGFPFPQKISIQSSSMMATFTFSDITSVPRDDDPLELPVPHGHRSP